MAGESNAHPATPPSVRARTMRSAARSGSSRRQVTQLRLGECGMAIGRVGPGEQRGECSPVPVAQVAEVDNGEPHVHAANVTR